LIEVGPANGKERESAPHPSLKPQALMRQLVWAALPCGKGIVLDPFMGAGSTVAAALYHGLRSIGIEANSKYFRMAKKAIPILARLESNGAPRGGMQGL
jgi:site-specific DNA-methyltransferase (adenine-specific)